MNITTSDNQDDWIKNAAFCIVSRIVESLKRKNEIIVAIPGGNTPILIWPKVFEIGIDIDWSRVLFMLTDERHVPLSSDSSNTGSVERIFRNFDVPLKWAISNNYYSDFIVWCDTIANKVMMNKFKPDIVWLGMGEDGHVASLFPPESGERRSISSYYVATISEKGPDRISMSAPAISSANFLIITISGRIKMSVLSKKRMAFLPVDDFSRLPNTKIVGNA